MKGDATKRDYLVCYEAEHAPRWLKWLLRFGWVSRLWKEHCLRKVNRMSTGAVLKKYYEVTDHAEQLH